MDAVLLGCLAGICFGAVNVSVRIGLRRCPDAVLAGAVSAFVAVVETGLVALAFVGPAAIDAGELWPFLLTGLIVPGASQILWIKSIQDAGASRSAIVMGTSPLLAALLAVVLLGEPFGLPLLLGTLLVVIGGIAIAREGSRPPGFRVVGLVFAFGVAVCLAARDNVARFVLVDRDVPSLAAAAALIAGACIFLLAYVVAVRWGRADLSTVRSAVLPFVPTGLLIGLVYITLLSALGRGPVTVVAPLNATSALWTVVFSALVIRRQELVGPRLALSAVLVVAGGALIAATR